MKIQVGGIFEEKIHQGKQQFTTGYGQIIPTTEGVQTVQTQAQSGTRG